MRPDLMTSFPNPRAQGTSPYRWLIVVLGLTILMLALYRWIGSHAPVNPATQPLRKIAIVPPFALTERSGKTITNHDLAGKIWVADFIYTTCPGPCPFITAGMAKIQDAVAQDPQVQLVTFTVDPETDTPAVLSAYADKFGADPNRWWFLTGPKKSVFDLIQNGFLQVVQDNSGQPPADGQFKVTHSTHLALVDGDGNLRNFYDGDRIEARADLLKDIKELESEAGQ